MSHIAPWSGKPPIRSGPHVASRLPQHLYFKLRRAAPARGITIDRRQPVLTDLSSFCAMYACPSY